MFQSDLSVGCNAFIRIPCVAIAKLDSVRSRIGRARRDEVNGSARSFETFERGLSGR